jgi:hypothetical protein
MRHAHGQTHALSRTRMWHGGVAARTSATPVAAQRRAGCGVRRCCHPASLSQPSAAQPTAAQTRLLALPALSDTRRCPRLCRGTL